MSVSHKYLEELLNRLSSDAQAEVLDFAEFLLSKEKQKSARPLRQDWGSALREYKNQYASLELQKKTLEWRGD